LQKNAANSRPFYKLHKPYHTCKIPTKMELNEWVTLEDS
jgi:hypothetical protein